MNNRLLPIIFAAMLLVSISNVYAAPPPPVKQFAHVVASNGTVDAQNYNSSLHLDGSGGTNVFYYHGHIVIYSKQGINGTNGMNGTNGINGTDGTNGRNGTNGTNGSTGPQGPRGFNGTDGTDGVNGTNGFNGTKGDKGDTGNTGPTGPRGFNGTNGTDGINGTNGTNGRNGTNGTNGSSAFFNSINCGSQFIQSYNNATYLASCNTPQITINGQNRSSFAFVANTTTSNLFSGKVNFTATSTKAGINIGTEASNPTSPRAGDIWTTSNTLRVQDPGNTTRTLVSSIVGGGNPITATSGSGGATITLSCSTCVTTGNIGLSAVTKLNTFSGKVNITSESGNVTITNNTGTITIGNGINDVITGGGNQTVTKPFGISKLIDSLSAIVGSADTSKKIKFLNSGMTTGITTTIRNNATSSQGINLPATSETETIAMRPALNFTTPSNPATTTSTTGVMSNLFATFTPKVTGRAIVAICGNIESGTAGDGAGFDVRYGTSLISEGTAIGNTVVGTEKIVTSSTVSKFQSACNTVEITGLAINTKIFIQIGKYAVTAGTATFSNFNVSVWEI